jgi:hypothetical protein
MFQNSYSQYALTALKRIQNYKDSYSLVGIWSTSSKEVFATKSSQEKNCPKNTFLGLCEEGLVKGIPQGNYTKSIKNKVCFKSCYHFKTK